MMSFLTNTAGRTLRYAINAQRTCLSVSRYSTEASELKRTLPKFWIAKMKSNFSWRDSDGDGYITENDFIVHEMELNKLLPLSKEQKDRLAANRKASWDIFGGKGQGADYKMTEDMYIERIFHLTTQEGSEYMLRREWENFFSALDFNNDGLISKSEHQVYFQSWKDPVGAIVAFTAIDQDMDGVISRDEFTKAGTEFYFNFTDESKPSKYLYGPLRY